MLHIFNIIFNFVGKFICCEKICLEMTLAMSRKLLI